MTNIYMEEMLKNKIDILTKENETLRKERDEARRMYCSAMSGCDEYEELVIAKDNGWDCFRDRDNV